jgi:Transglutaminase-like superfamily
MSDRPRALRPLALLSLCAALLAAVPARAAQEWEVTFALRLSVEKPQAVELNVALPAASESLHLLGIDVTARGLEASIQRDGPQPAATFRGKIKSSRRVAVTYTLETRREHAAVPPVPALDDPPEEVLPYLHPSPLFQSRSILVRDFLETYVRPQVSDPHGDLLRPIFEVTRRQIERAKDGKTLVLDVIRRRRAQRLGIERTFTTFLRCARIPARFVEGIGLNRSTRRKSVYWTEVWAQGRWWPVSASEGWIGRRPASYVALTRDGKRAVRVENGAKVSYIVDTHRLDPTPKRIPHRKK